jgi:hypothetical protein
MSRLRLSPMLIKTNKQANKRNLSRQRNYTNRMKANAWNVAYYCNKYIPDNEKYNQLILSGWSKQGGWNGQDTSHECWQWEIHINLIRTPEKKWSFGRSWHKWKYNIKLDLRRIGCGSGVGFNFLAVTTNDGLCKHG